MRVTDKITQNEFFLIFYTLLPTTSVGNEWGQQMRIQILNLGFKGLMTHHYLLLQLIWFNDIFPNMFETMTFFS